MPPKKRKTTGGGRSAPQYIWLLKYESGGGRSEFERYEVLYLTKEKAIAGVPHLMEAYNQHGDDWRNGLEGFGQEEDDPYLQYEYHGDSIGDNGGVILTNEHSDFRSSTTVSLKRVRVDPPKSDIKRDDEQDTSDDDLGGVAF